MIYKKNCYEISEKLVGYFFFIIKSRKSAQNLCFSLSHISLSSLLILKKIMQASKFQAKSLKTRIEYLSHSQNSTRKKKNLYWFTIKIHNYYF